MKPSVCARWPPHRAPFLRPTPLVVEPGSYTHSRPSGLRTQGWGVGGSGADLSRCAWQEASQTQQRERELASALIISSSRAMAPTGDQEAGSIFACCFITKSGTSGFWMESY